MNELIPPPDPLGIPSPVWIFQFLYILTLVLHIIFMNYILGGTFIVMLNEWFAGKDPKVAKANSILVKVMPFSLSLAITMGVAPLLFVQVMYGQFFYSANIMMGGFWLLLLALVTIAFYMIYVLIAKRSNDQTSNSWTRFGITLNTLLFFTVAFLWTNNAILTENPKYWPDIYTGARSVIAPDLSLWPRYLHNVIGAVAVAGLWMCCIARFQARHHPENQQTADWMERNGMVWATIATVINTVVGFAYLGVMPLVMEEFMKKFMGNGILFVGWSISIVTAILALVHMILALVKPEKKGFLWGAVGLIVLTLFGMVMGRSLIRYIQLEEYFTVSELTVRPHYGSLILFLVTFLIGLAVLGYLIYMILKIPPKSNDSVSQFEEESPQSES